jgi:hypothetical protein
MENNNTKEEVLRKIFGWASRELNIGESKTTIVLDNKRNNRCSRLIYSNKYLTHVIKKLINNYRRDRTYKKFKISYKKSNKENVWDFVIKCDYEEFKYKEKTLILGFIRTLEIIEENKILFIKEFRFSDLKKNRSLYN